MIAASILIPLVKLVRLARSCFDHLEYQPQTGAPTSLSAAVVYRGVGIEVIGEVRGLDWFRVNLVDGSVGFVWARLLQPSAP